MSDFHTVRQGETLTKIAKEHGVTVDQLTRLNHFSNPNSLKVGQHIALNPQETLGFQPLFLDRNRDPIAGMFYILEYCGKRVEAVTTRNGLGEQIFTNSIDNLIKVSIRQIDGTILELGNIASGLGNKLSTFISPYLYVKVTTELHPESSDSSTHNKYDRPRPKFPPSEKSGKMPTTEKKTLGIQVEQSKSSTGAPIAIVTGDIPDLSFLGVYVGGEITETDIDAAAKSLKCEPSLIYAIARQESAHSSFMTLGSRVVPTILYERHWFRKLTRTSKTGKSQYEDNYHDICGPAYHKTKRVIIVEKSKDGKSIKKKVLVDAETGVTPIADEIYGSSGLSQYKRLCKAYQLDKSAALQSCSWGKFQIMGFNYKACGYSDVFSFVKAMSSGDPAHIKAFLGFASQNSILLDGLRSKNYEKIAEGHNGSGWRALNPEYASNIERFSKEYESVHK